ncbi:carboxypeptidase S1 [Choiromyces venosus 120613-1]|uniref:Carboxypeptidase S1 n=1 Tax=Choiromyces venosus 120613-1 TaxID=1336337 RepID=A0A3N4J575_9PEZI|nr:carboxypeptidase S1 [Choiromyces venosus 120613-1]
MKSLIAFFYLLAVAYAAYPPLVTDTQAFTSKRIPGISVTYRSPKICEKEGIKQYSGYVRIPPNTMSFKQDYPINTFFWFFEAHKEPEKAPLTVYLNGGPGSSSIAAGEVNNDSATTAPREWAWNKLSNMLFIDQPVQVGFSYDNLHNGTWGWNSEKKKWEYKLVGFQGEIPPNNATFYTGTFPSMETKYATNSTHTSSEAFWYAMQGWTEAFPRYMSEGLSIYTQSYGGKYGPGFGSFIERENDRIRAGEYKDSPKKPDIIQMNTIGLLSACIDLPEGWGSVYTLGANNTFGIPFLSQPLASSLHDQFHRPGGCKEQYYKYVALYPQDPYGDQGIVGNCVKEANSGVCNITHEQNRVTEHEYMVHMKRHRFDYTQSEEMPFPYKYALGYLMRADVQKELGVPLNFTSSSAAVYEGFEKTGDKFSPGSMEQIAFLLGKGVRVSLSFGDRDYACNWFGGERSSLALEYPFKKKFASAGYQKLLVDDIVGGEVREHGNFSFVRVYQAGHNIPAYQPLVSFKIFQRILQRKDLATGTTDIHDDYTTTGPLKSTTKNYLPKEPLAEPECYIPTRLGCTNEQNKALIEGSAVVEDYLVVQPGRG